MLNVPFSPSWTRKSFRCSFGFVIWAGIYGYCREKKWTFKIITWVRYHQIFLSRNTELHVDREGVTCQKTPQFGKKEYYCACVPNQMKIINLQRKVSNDSPTLSELPEVLQSLVSTSFLRCLPQPSLPRFLVQGGLRSEEQENIKIYTVKEIFYSIRNSCKLMVTSNNNYKIMWLETKK